MVVCGKFSGQLGDRIFCLQNPDVGFQDILFISVKQFRFLFGRKRKCLRYLINIRQFDLGDFIRVQLENRKQIFSISFIFAECLQGIQHGIFGDCIIPINRYAMLRSETDADPRIVVCIFLVNVFCFDPVFIILHPIFGKCKKRIRGCHLEFFFIQKPIRFRSVSIIIIGKVVGKTVCGKGNAF